ncbi:MAG: GAF domain-containing protein [Acidimicrobiales bacterium]
MLSGRDVAAVLDHQTAMVSALTAGAPLHGVLDAIVRALEEMMPASRCSILLLDGSGTLRHGSAPSLPAEYSARIDGLVPGPLAGSCGTAVYHGEPVIAVDVTIDLRWAAFRELAVRHGLRACWSSFSDPRPGEVWWARSPCTTRCPTSGDADADELVAAFHPPRLAGGGARPGRPERAAVEAVGG